MARQLTLIRHGESQSNANFPTTDPFVIQLTENGFAQAEAAAEALTEIPSLIISSPMTRAIQTSDAFRKRFPATPLEIWDVQEFVFLRFDDDGETTPEQRRPLVDAYWHRCNPDEINAGSDCESFRSFLKRVASFHGKAVFHQSEMLLVISHGLFIHAFRYMVEHDFPACTPELMTAIFQAFQRDPIGNCQSLQFAK